MKLIFIRHAEPDYSIDSLTQKGVREAELLTNRTKNWDVTQFYSSPLGRAQATARPTLDARKIPFSTVFPDEAPDVIHTPDPAKAIVYPWLREFTAPIDPDFHPVGKRISWDLTPKYMDENPIVFDPQHWSESPLYQTGAVKEQYDWVCTRMDDLLRVHGYDRTGTYYRTAGTGKPSDWYMKYDGTTKKCMEQLTEKEPVLVFFCHLGVMMTIVSHLINTSPAVLLQGCFIPPSSVTILSSEERIPGEAMFRIQTMGDTSHLRDAGEPVSFYGGFAAPFQL